MKPIKDHTNEVYGRLTVLEFIERKNRNSYWKCKCDCGNEIIIPITYLTSGDTKSCGCLRKETTATLSKKNSFVKNKRLYTIWIDMKRRCYNKKRNAYIYYGLKGIKICEEWKDNFKAFQEWAFKSGYKDNLTIDRIDTNKDYEPRNCRWATIKEQNNNMSSNHIIEYKGEKYTLSQLAEKYNLDYSLVKNRIRYNWDIEKIITTPKRGGVR